MEAIREGTAMVSLRLEMILEGLNCAHCGAKIEAEVNRLEGVTAASLNFLTKTLSVSLADHNAHSLIHNEIKGIVQRIEPGVSLRLPAVEQPAVRRYRLRGLGCANCAAKMEREISRLAGVRLAAVDFGTATLTIEADRAADFVRIAAEAGGIIHRIEPDTIMDDAARPEAEPAEESEKKARQWEIARLAGGGVLFATALVFSVPGRLQLIWYLTAYLLAGGEIIRLALRNISRGQVFDENFLMTVASAGAFVIGEFPEGVAVMLFYQVGELLQELAVDRSRRSIRALLDIRPEAANLMVAGEIRIVPPESVNPGETIIVKPGEKIPLDGEITDGTSWVDTSALTGEAVPREVQAGDSVLGGFINRQGLLTVRVTKPFNESAVARILDLVQNAASRKAPTEKFITRFARYYTPAVVYTALAMAVLPPLLVPGATLADWAYRALIFLVVSCPCALVISIPLGFFGGIGGASRNGILIKGSNYLEALSAVETVVFDKTGTLTQGVFKVREVMPRGDFTAEAVLAAAALAESYSNHPIAQSILAAYPGIPDQSGVENYTEQPGQGVRIRSGGRELLAGNRQLLEQAGVEAEDPAADGTVVQVAIDGQYAGYILIADEIKPDAAATIMALKRLGVKRTVLLTGDRQSSAAKVGRLLGLEAVYAELLPEDKVRMLEELSERKTPGRKVVFVGDGINDAPVLARADIGVAMGALGSAAAIEAADVVLMADEPMQLVSAIRIARRTRGIVWQNIVFALGVKAVVLLLGAWGLATMWGAVFADVGVALIALLNAMRVMGWRSKPPLAQ